MEKKHQNVVSKGFREEIKKNNTNMVFENEREEKTKKKKTKSKWRILKEAVSGESNSHKISANCVP